jgi:hypothetical protein
MIHPRRAVILGPPSEKDMAKFTGTYSSPKGSVAPAAMIMDVFVTCSLKLALKFGPTPNSKPLARRYPASQARDTEASSCSTPPGRISSGLSGERPRRAEGGSHLPDPEDRVGLSGVPVARTPGLRPSFGFASDSFC